jgi:hypothetical protein
MRWGLFFFACFCHAQTTIHVRDEAGRPIEEAQLQFSGSRLFEERTDTTGAIVITAKDSFALVRKPGFFSARVALNQPEVDVTLRRSDRVLKQCPPPTFCGSTTLCFPPFDKIVLRGRIPDTDHTMGVLGLASDRSRNAPQLTHGLGPNWSSGLPPLRDVELSTMFVEESFPLNEAIWVVDSRGTLGNGTRWRQIGIYGETVGFRTDNQKAAGEFDKYLDTLCLRPSPLK